MITEQRIRELAAYASDPCADVQHWLAAQLLAARAELAAMRADRDAALLILPACCGSLADAADTLRQERDTLRQERDTLLKAVAAKDELLASYRAAMERGAIIHPRPWWVVFGLDRIVASKMHQEAAVRGSTIVEMALQNRVDDADKRGVHPVEVQNALRDARAELLPETNAAGGGA